MRTTIRPGLVVDDLRILMGEKRDVAGSLIVPCSRNDLKIWFDAGRFGNHSYVQGDKDINFRALHRSCVMSTLMLGLNVDRPKHKVVCNMCLRGWELHALEALPPKSFGDTFEYKIVPRGEWPCVLATMSNGVTKYTATREATVPEAAEYYFREFEAYRKNGFIRSKQ